MIAGAAAAANSREGNISPKASSSAFGAAKGPGRKKAVFMGSNKMCAGLNSHTHRQSRDGFRGKELEPWIVGS